VKSLSRVECLQSAEGDCEEETGTMPTAHPSVMIAPGEPLVLTVAEAGALLGVSRAFAYELVARGVLPVIRLGRRIVIPKAALIRMIDAASQLAEVAR
jgi:excisionase family DNA binding protein